MNQLAKWVNPVYLRPRVIESIKQSVLAKPEMQYAVLDNFFREEELDKLIEQHKTLSFDEEQDRRAGDGSWLPYDGAVCWANESHYGHELFFSREWQEYSSGLVNVQPEEKVRGEVKLRWHRAQADGFWIHSDGSRHKMVILAYFNKNWKASDGGLLQLWRADEGLVEGTPAFNIPQGRMDFLNQHTRLRTSTPGGGFPGGGPRDLVLVDQICPEYNRVVICNFETNPCYHSVTPSNGRERTGFVQWFYKGG